MRLANKKIGPSYAAPIFCRLMRDAPAGKVFFFIIQKGRPPVKNAGGIARLFSTIFAFSKTDDLLDTDAMQILFSVTADVTHLLFFVTSDAKRLDNQIGVLFSVILDAKRLDNRINALFSSCAFPTKKAPFPGACLFYFPSARAMRSLSKPTISSSPMMITGTPI